MHGNRHGAAVFYHDVMAAMNTVQPPTGGFEFGDRLLAVHGTISSIVLVGTSTPSSRHIANAGDVAGHVKQRDAKQMLYLVFQAALATLKRTQAL